jgi:hypothetical protein
VYTGKGRPPVKGARLPKPCEAVSAARRYRRLTVGWYGGGTRRVQTLTATGHWFKSGKGLVPIRWAFVRDREGTHRDEYFYTTDPGLSVEQLIGYYTGRWNIETTFEEVRSCLHLETARGWCRSTVLRVAPCLFGLYSVVALLYNELPASRRVRSVEWPGKVGVTFADALTTVRRWAWTEGVFARVEGGSTIRETSGRFTRGHLLGPCPSGIGPRMCTSRAERLACERRSGLVSSNAAICPRYPARRNSRACGRDAAVEQWSSGRTRQPPEGVPAILPPLSQSVAGI